MTRKDSLGRRRRPEQDATQFQPLDATSPTVLVQLKMPQALLEELDAAADEAGLTRSAALRQAAEAWLEHPEP